ncbi:MAG TPA: polyphosphate kinase 2 family protein [Myxococcota bacterium]|nr:polyphosphate kinase 2 family protein [Myxococcota bacterium]
MPNQPSLRALADRCRVEDGARFRLRHVDPDDTAHIESAEEAAKGLAEGLDALRELQQKLYAQDCWALLAMFQGIDAAGKDSTIAHVMSGVNPQGCQVWSFKQPSQEDLDHDFLWRTTRCLPERGRIGIWNRSYYEEVLVVRVHPELLAAEHLPKPLLTKHIWRERFEDIVAHERYLTRNGVAVVKFLLHISKKEQRRRFLARLQQRDKNWKFAPGDIAERGHWGEYQRAFDEMVRATSTEHAPWYVVPADHKWFARLVVAAALVETLRALGVDYPKLDAVRRRELARIRAALEREK